jgi:hypothetical protein
MQQFSNLLSWRLYTAQHVFRQKLSDCSGSLWFYLRIVVTVVLCSWSGRPAVRPDHEHSTTHHDTKVKPEAATAVIELLMMGEKTPETCWAVNKRQDNKLENCCIWLEIYLNCTMMHGLTNLKLEETGFDCTLCSLTEQVIQHLTCIGRCPVRTSARTPTFLTGFIVIVFPQDIRRRRVLSYVSKTFFQIVSSSFFSLVHTIRRCLKLPSAMLRELQSHITL